MSYGVGTVFLPMVRRVLVGTLIIEVGYITYDCAVKPMAKTAMSLFNPKRPKPSKSK
ncbi:hypothetical protein MACJ_003523 [Theileria orientalis]|uniref:Uncharacterized protein n=1 Tax=Theileria orientalis TaxID=68886 RepID=A0A976SKK5_THEOR|nr:hypothetical protein MACJ_003523 [Theileria orientalis]